MENKKIDKVIDNLKNKYKQFKDEVILTVNKAKKGSKPHIAIILGVIIAVILIITGIVYGFNSYKLAKELRDAEINDNAYNKDELIIDKEKFSATVLEETEDAGQEYIDETLFIGDSNTVRTMMYGYTTWDNVVAAVSMGVQHIKTLELAYFKGYSKPLTVPEAVKLIQPRRIIITYGTNNTIGYSTETFIEKYKDGLKAIEEAYPYADIIINAIPPIDRQRENINVTMQTIDKFNIALAEMAQEEGYKFLNSAQALKDDETGFAKANYTIGDGIHINKNGMEALFNYIRTHAYITEDRRPMPLNKVPDREETPTGIITQDPLAVRGSKISILFNVNDSELGYIDGEIEQKVKATLSCDAVTAKPKLENGGIFTGWSVSYGSLDNSDNASITYTVPKVEDSVSEIRLIANFRKAELKIRQNGGDIGELKLSNGASVNISAYVEEAFTGDKTVTWSSSNPTIAAIDQNGNITALSGGITHITASILNGAISATCEVTVTQPLSSISITGNNTLPSGATTQLNLVLNPTGATADVSKAIWSSSDTSVATVSQNGLVSALDADGTTTITCTLEGKTAQFVLTVVKPKPLEGISLTGNNSIVVGQTTQISVVYNPTNTTDNKNATWASSRPDVATVTNGVVTGVNEGVTVITCTVGNFTATIDITVTLPLNTVETINISQTTLSTTAGATFSLTATPILLDPTRPADVDITPSWSSSSGYIIIGSDGNALVRSDLISESGVLYDTITVSIGGKTASCLVTIQDVPVS